MQTFWTIALLIIGIALIVKGGDFFVNSAVWIAKVLRIPVFIIGATIVSLATTLPEVIVSLIAAAEGNVGIAVGNAIGSVTANTGLIMSITLIFTPFAIKRMNYMLRCLLMLGSVVLLYVLVIKGELNIWLSLLLFIPLTVFIVDNLRSARKEMRIERLVDIDAIEAEQEKPVKPVDTSKKTIMLNTLFFIIGTAGIIGGAQLLVNNGEKLASILGVPDSIIAVTLVAVGTSLPELVTTVTALLKKESELSAGNIIGANIMDVTIILPFCAIVSGKSLPIEAASISIDFPFCVAISAIAVIPTLVFGKFNRWQGIIMLITYAAYIAVRVIFI